MRIQVDHHLVFHTRTSSSICVFARRTNQDTGFEYGRLLACQGDKDGALKHFEYVTAPESNPAGWRGKYNLEVGTSTRL